MLFKCVDYTELDQTGFEKGSDELLDRVENLTQAVDTLGDNLTPAGSEPVAAISAAGEAAAPRKVALSDDGGRLKVETAGATWYLDATGWHQ